MNKIEILQTMAGIQSVAENEKNELGDFLPLNSYMQLSDPERFLILGGRGSGKTRVFRTLLLEHGFRSIVGEEKILFRPTADNAKFIAGYNGLGSVFPPQSVMQSPENLECSFQYWAGSLIILLLDYYSENEAIRKLAEQELDPGFLAAVQPVKKLKRPDGWMKYIKERPEEWESFLDDVNDYLNKENQWLFFAYDYLDLICSKYSDLFPYIKALLSFWLSHSLRWSRLKCKIFLRNDLYDSEQLAFPDFSKLKSHSIKLEWNTTSLYRLLIKRLANSGNEETLKYLKLTDGLIADTLDPNLGFVPTEKEELLKEFVERFIGKYMGANSKKGISYAWAPNHLQDTHGVLVPRSFLKLYSAAARAALEHADELDKLSGTKILLPIRLQGAIQEVSEDRVEELSEEYTWIKQLKQAFDGITLLMPKAQFLEKIDMKLWGGVTADTLPAETPAGIFGVLEKLGIVFVARDGRVNVPEIYLHGFRMRRKGGLKRPN